MEAAVNIQTARIDDDFMIFGCKVYCSAVQYN
jgi:hypothetical protein